MTSKSTKLQRWLDIIAYLVGRRLPVSIDELMTNVPAYAARWASDDPTSRASARRGFERDKKELRELGIPIRTVPYHTDELDTVEGYIIERRDFYLPYLNLVKRVSGRVDYAERARVAKFEIAEADAPLALEALRRVSEVPGFPLLREARSAFRKLAFDIDPAEYAPRESVLFVERPGAAELTQSLRTLSNALLARKRVRFGYHGIYRGERTERDVAGYGLLLQQGHWYFIGHDALRDDVRVFRVGRMEDVVANANAPGTPDYDVPAGFRLNDFAGRRPWELGDQDEEPVAARVRFLFPRSLWVERNGFGELDTKASDGAQVRTFSVHQVGPFLRWLLGMEGEAYVVEPVELREEMRRMAAEIATAHGDGEARG